jgi:hypothetical protein
MARYVVQVAELPQFASCLYMVSHNLLMHAPHTKRYVITLMPLWSRVSSVGIATSYGLDDRGVGVRVLVGSGIFSSPNRPDRL